MSRRPTPPGGVVGGTLSPGTVLAGRYQIEKVIGTGGMGAVYSARDRRFRAVLRRCAVKEMFDGISEVTARQRARDQFEREANLLAGISHAAIPRVFDYFTEGERHYLVYEYVEGQDLARVLYQRARPIEPDRVTDWGIQLTNVLEKLHSSQPPIIFRDLKPSNVMLRSDGKLVLIDFGIAKHFQPVQKGTMIGTEGYAPPEQYEGVANPRVDIYALGATLHQLLTNTDPQEFRPFSYDKRPIKQYNPATPDILVEAVERALAYSAEDRWETMGDLREALEHARVAADPSRQVTNSESGVTRPIGVGGTGLFERHRRAQRAGDPAATESKPPPASEPIGPETTPIDQQRAAPSAPSSAEPAVAPTPPGESGPLEIPNDTAIVPIWTFGSEEEIRSTPTLGEERLYIGSYDYNLYCVDLLSGEFRWKFATRGGVPGTAVLWKQLVIVGSEDQQIYGIHRLTGKLEWSTQTQGRVRSSPQVIGNIVVVGSDDGFVYALEARNGHLLWKHNVGAPVRSSATSMEESVFMGAEDGSVIALDLESGEQLWRVHTGGPVISSPVLLGERLIVGSMDRQLYSLDQKSGWVVWRIRLSDRVYATSAVVDDLIYAATVDGVVYCLEGEWGKEIWKRSLGTQVTSSPFVAEDGNLYIGGIDGALYCLGTRRGKVRWRFPTGGSIPGSPRVLDGVVYVGSMDYRLYALPTEPAPARFS